VITLDHVTKAFDGHVAVADVSLTVDAGTTHVLLGTSGSGKSTILRMILGLLLPDRGDVVVDGVRVTAATRATVVRRMGYVVQEGALYPHLTGYQNVTLAARAQGWSEPRMRERAAALAAMVELDATTLARYPAELSGGQRQRIGLMRALMLDPPVLLLDEPLGALDPLVKAELEVELCRLFSRLGKTVVLVTHDLREALVLGDTITLLTGGRVVQQGTFDDLAQRPADAFVTKFLSAQTPPERPA
jgi:osmoprotectant transport system ATP-binding protein